MDRPANAGHVRIFSDLHLGHKLSRVADTRALRPLLDGVGTAVFNGDTWQELAREFRPLGERQLTELRAICAEAGAAPVFLPGNHDPGWPGDGWLAFGGRRVVVTHGDALLPAGSPWKREILSNEARVAELWREHPEAARDPAARIRLARAIANELRSVEPPGGRSFLRRVWDAVVPPRRALHILEAWLVQGREGGRFCDRFFPEARFLVIGHFHRAGCWTAGDRVVINTGSFMSPGRACVVDWFPGERRLVWADVDERDPAAWRRGRIHAVWRLA